MVAKWILTQTERKDTGFCLRLGLQGQDPDQIVYLQPECCNAVDLQALAQELIDSLQQTIKEAEDLWQPAAKSNLIPGRDPEEIWQQMQAMAEGDMADFFNALDSDLRRQVAEHILTTASMFKGAGAMFAARYDADQGLIGL